MNGWFLCSHDIYPVHMISHVPVVRTHEPILPKVSVALLMGILTITICVFSCTLHLRPRASAVVLPSASVAHILNIAGKKEIRRNKTTPTSQIGKPMDAGKFQPLHTRTYHIHQVHTVRYSSGSFQPPPDPRNPSQQVASRRKFQAPYIHTIVYI